jgi:hypothetical protein
MQYKYLVMTHSDESIRQLTATVNILATVVAKNENRYLSIERAFRWIAVAFLCLVMMVFYMGFNMVSQVQANAIESGIENVVANLLKVSIVSTKNRKNGFVMKTPNQSYVSWIAYSGTWRL